MSREPQPSFPLFFRARAKFAVETPSLVESCVDGHEKQEFLEFLAGRPLLESDLYVVFKGNAPEMLYDVHYDRYECLGFLVNERLSKYFTGDADTKVPEFRVYRS